MEDLQTLQKVVEAVRLCHANIAPTYDEYFHLTAGISSSCGEAGRSYYHELCSYSPKYRQAEADKFYSYCLKQQYREFSMGTVVYLARQAGADIDFRPERAPGFLPSSFEGNSLTHTHVYNNVEEVSEQLAEVKFPLFPSHAWPAFLQQMIDCAPTPAQRDALFLSSITVLSSTVNWLIHTFYGDGDTYPNLLCFISGKPASGKSVVNWARQLVLPYQEEALQQYKLAKTDYLKAKQAWECAGNKRIQMEMPQEPLLKLFLIPGNNSSTGIKENLINAQGIGLIAETEADTMGSAISADYGHWSDTLRKGYDNDEISYYRRTEHEYRQCPRSCFSVQLTGTYGQITRLIPSTEDGLYSRFLFYLLPPIHEWTSQFNRHKVNIKQQFYQWGKNWKEVLDAVRGVATSFDLEINDAQVERFNARFSQVFGKAGVVYGDRIESSVARLGLNLCRIMTLIAFMRVLEHLLPVGEQTLSDTLPSDPKALLQKLLQSPYLSPARHVPAENVADQVITSFTMTLNDDDFDALLQLVEPLYKHAGYVMSMLPQDNAPQMKHDEGQLLLNSLPLTFSRREAVKQGAALGMKEKAVDSQLQRAVQSGALVKKERGYYQFSSPIKGTRVCGKYPPKGRNEGNVAQ